MMWVPSRGLGLVAVGVQHGLQQAPLLAALARRRIWHCCKGERVSGTDAARSSTSSAVPIASGKTAGVRAPWSTHIRWRRATVQAADGMVTPQQLPQGLLTRQPVAQEPGAERPPCLRLACAPQVPAGPAAPCTDLGAGCCGTYES